MARSRQLFDRRGLAEAARKIGADTGQSSASGGPPPHGTPPGHGGTPPGHGGTPPGLAPLAGLMAPGGLGSAFILGATRGFVSVAAPAGDALQLIYSNTLAAPGPIDTGANGVPQSGAHLLIYTHLRSTLAASDSDLIACQFNGSTTGYVWQRLAGVVTATSVTNSGPDTQMLLGEMPATNPTANGFGDAIMFIPNYTDTTTLKTALSIWGRLVSGNGASGINFSWWPQTSALTRMRIYALNANPNLATGSSVYIYSVT